MPDPQSDNAFPGHGAGEVPDAFVLEVAGISVRVVSANPSVRIAPGSASRAFLRASADGGASVDAVLRVRAGDPANLESGRLVFDSGGVWRLFVLEDGTSCYRFHDARSGERPYKILLLEAGEAEGEIVLDEASLSTTGPVDPLEFPLDELLFLTLLARKGGVELHACGVRDPNGRGFLFAGHSVDGKTTMARLWEAVPGAVVLSDDRIVVREGPAGRWEMHGTPWHGEAELAANVSAGVAGIFVLGRGVENGLRGMSRSEAVSALLSRSFPPFHSDRRLFSALGTLDGLVGRVPCRSLAFVPDEDVVRFVLEDGR